MANRCPKCRTSTMLYEDVEVPGWRAIDENLEPTGDREVLWGDAVAIGPVGCSCGWEGSRAALEPLGVDGEPLPEIHPEQQTLEAA